jgi:PTH1 family peptidyl-tRNA hydrolase
MALSRLVGSKAFRPAFRGELAEKLVDNEKIIFFKPLTYMNLSGQALAPLASRYKIAPADILVICDDMNLPLGRLRLRNRGSAGGHNGLKSVIASLGADDFWRLRIGVGRPLLYDSTRHVLTRFAVEEKETLESALTRTVEAALLWCQGRSGEAMNIYNRAENL